MTDILKCCALQSLNEPYIGVQQKCQQSAIFCIEHNPHKNSEGLLHQMLPLKNFKRTLQQKKIKMNQKIGLLIDQYNQLMDCLLQQIQQLKLRKNIQFSMLWLRQLAKDQEQYQLMRQIYRMDFENLTCSKIHSIYFKIVHNQILEKKSLKQIDCYKGICQILQKLSKQKQSRIFLSKKISQIEGILQNGQILKRTLPDRLEYKQNIKQVLLQSANENFIEVKYNKCRMSSASRQYISIFSKYPIVSHNVYYLNIFTKYSNFMIGICSQNFKNTTVQKNKNNFDQHYSKQSLVYNCTNGCVYKDGMFASGTNNLTKNQKQLNLKLRITQNQLILIFGKNILCRQKLPLKLIQNKLYLHILMRNQGDNFEVCRDKNISSDHLIIKKQKNHQCLIKKQLQQKQNNPNKNHNQQQLFKRNQEEFLKHNLLKQSIIQEKMNLINFRSQLQHQKNQQTKKIITNNNKKTNYQKEYIKMNKILNQQEQQKQKKINQLIKRQRIEKILNDIKSKPLNQQRQQIAKKVEEIRQKKSILSKNKFNQNNHLNQQSSLIMSQHLEQNQNLKKNIQKDNCKLIHINQINSLQFGQSNIKSQCFNPLLMANNNKSDQKVLQDILMSKNNLLENSNDNLIKNQQNQIKEQRTLQKNIKPSEKSFQFFSQQSFNFEVMNSIANVQSPKTNTLGDSTPIQKIQQNFLNQQQKIKKNLQRKQNLRILNKYSKQQQIQLLQSVILSQQNFKLHGIGNISQNNLDLKIKQLQFKQIKDTKHFNYRKINFKDQQMRSPVYNSDQKIQSSNYFINIHSGRKKNQMDMSYGSSLHLKYQSTQSISSPTKK